MSEQLIAHGVVLWAAAYMSWRLLPGTWRNALGARCRQLAQRIGLAQAESQAPGQRSDAQFPPGCGACTGCATRQRPASTVIIKTIKKGNKC